MAPPARTTFSRVGATRILYKQGVFAAGKTISVDNSVDNVEKSAIQLQTSGIKWYI